MKTSELTGAALNWAVAKCEGYTDLRVNLHPYDKGLLMTPPRKAYGAVYLIDLRYSTDWSQGGPIIERERIEIKRGNPLYFPSGTVEIDNYYELLWLAGKHHGTTPLIAAMREYVASKLGNEVEIPEELE